MVGYVDAMIDLGTTQVICRLQIDPELSAGTQTGCQPQSYVCCDSASQVHNFENGRRGNVEHSGQSCWRNVQWVEVLFHQNFARVDGAHAVIKHKSPQW